MKTNVLICCAMLLNIATTYAQEPAPEKEVLVVDIFSRTRVVPAPYLEAVREQVMGAFLDRGRHAIVDGEATRMLPEINPATAITTLEAAPVDMTGFLEFRAPQAAAAGARYVVSGSVVDYKFAHATIPSTDSKKTPRQGYKSSFVVLLAGYDTKLQQQLPTERYELSAVAPVAEDADRAALAPLRRRLEFYINNHFKFETQILELCPPDRKGRIRELFVHSGTAIGVKPGDLFLVFEEVPIGGVITRQKVGRLRVNNVENPSVARCKIAKGEEEIANAFLNNRTLICISDGEAFF